MVVPARQDYFHLCILQKALQASEQKEERYENKANGSSLPGLSIFSCCCQ